MYKGKGWGGGGGSIFRKSEKGGGGEGPPSASQQALHKSAFCSEYFHFISIYLILRIRALFEDRDMHKGKGWGGRGGSISRKSEKGGGGEGPPPASQQALHKSAFCSDKICYFGIFWQLAICYGKLEKNFPKNQRY